MALVEPEMSRQERVEQEAEATAARVMGQMNVLARGGALLVRMPRG